MLSISHGFLRDAFAGISLIFWSIQLVPQAWKNYQQGSTKGFSILLLISWLAEAISFFAYGCSLHLAIPLLLQPQAFALVSVFCFLQYLYYDVAYSRTKCALLGLVMIITIAIIETLGALFLLHLQDSSGDVQWISKVFGIFPTLLILIGYISQYVEIIRSRSAKGLSLLFLALDITGAIAALISLAFHTHPDPEIILNYLATLLPASGLLALAFYHRTQEILPLSSSQTLLNLFSLIFLMYHHHHRTFTRVEINNG
ncbi:MAG: hypothetical protein DHS80DRAFT_31392 [Piptocephalis tieghemiana]|nr:MAG: hypothetical protein DHS80DRAFT_31392 [Piptocephalis tieghemiana]